MVAPIVMVTSLRYARAMSDVRFQSIEDTDLADIWYALGGAATRHAEHFKPLFEVIATELLERRGDGLNPWLEQRFREFRLSDSKEDAEANLKVSPEADISPCLATGAACPDSGRCNCLGAAPSEVYSRRNSLNLSAG